MLDYPEVRVLKVEFPPLPDRLIAATPEELFLHEREEDSDVRSLRQAVGAEAFSEIERLFDDAKDPCPRVYYGGYEYSRGGPDGRWVYHRARDLAREMSDVVATPSVRRLRARLRATVGVRLVPSGLLEGFRTDRTFHGTVVVPGKKSWRLSIADEASSAHPPLRAHLALCTDGPNLGSAGGPTLIEAAVLAVIEYEGILPAVSPR